MICACILDAETLKKHSLSFLSNIIEVWYLITQGFMGICGIIKVFRLCTIMMYDMCMYIRCGNMEEAFTVFSKQHN